MTDTLEKRVAELETTVWDFPNLWNLRVGRYDAEFASVRAAIADNTSRLEALERAMTNMQADMRDLRGGVTRQLVAQDGQLREMKADIRGLRSDFGELKSDVGSLKSDVGELKFKVSNIDSAVQEVLRRLPRR